MLLVLKIVLIAVVVIMGLVGVCYDRVRRTENGKGLVKCWDCGQLMDPTTCWCGDPIDEHHEGHSCTYAIPMGCNCGRYEVIAEPPWPGSKYEVLAEPVMQEDSNDTRKPDSRD